MAVDKKEKSDLVEMRVVLSHPKKEFRLGRHVIKNVFAKYELNESEQKELMTAGPKKWLEIKK